MKVFINITAEDGELLDRIEVTQESIASPVSRMVLSQEIFDEIERAFERAAITADLPDPGPGPGCGPGIS